MHVIPLLSNRGKVDIPFQLPKFSKTTSPSLVVIIVVEWTHTSSWPTSPTPNSQKIVSTWCCYCGLGLCFSFSRPLLNHSLSARVLCLSPSKREAIVQPLHVFIRDPHFTWGFFNVSKIDRCKVSFIHKPHFIFVSPIPTFILSTTNFSSKKNLVNACS